MKWGTIQDEYVGFAWKRLSSHEIDKKVSNGHEFQGVAALKALLGEARAAVVTTYYLLGDCEGGVEVVEVKKGISKWYDSREFQKGRSPEWRLYYPAEATFIQEKCSEGDLVVIALRNNGELSIILATADSSNEAAIKNLLGIGRVEPKGRGDTKYTKELSGDIGLEGSILIEQLNLSFDSINDLNAQPIFPVIEVDIEADDEAEAIYLEFIKLWPKKLGTSAEVIELILEKSSLSDQDVKNDPDFALNRWLELGEASYRAWEKNAYTNYLKPLRLNEDISDLELVELISEKWMSFRQGRVSRAGRVMEAFINKIFKVNNLEFEWGSTIEGDKKPDFIFPGKKEFEDELYPVEKLRLLGAKTTMKERWRQILAESTRVEKKHGITRDISITDRTFKSMEKIGFTLVVPEAVKKKYPSGISNLMNLKEFIAEVKEEERANALAGV